MTKKECLEICLRLWKWLKETGSYDKSEWPGWERNGGTTQEMFSDCPCCQYAKPKPRNDAACKKCPLNGYAWETTWSCGIYAPPYYPCECSDSPYKLWYSFPVDSDNDDKRRKCALQIVSAIERALEDIEDCTKKACVASQRKETLNGTPI